MNKEKPTSSKQQLYHIKHRDVGTLKHESFASVTDVLFTLSNLVGAIHWSCDVVPT